MWGGGGGGGAVSILYFILACSKCMADLLSSTSCLSVTPSVAQIYCYRYTYCLRVGVLAYDRHMCM